MVSKPATNQMYNSSSKLSSMTHWYFPFNPQKHQGHYKESHRSVTRQGSTMKGNFSQQKFSRSHFLMHSSRFVPLRWHCSCCQSVKGNVRFHLSTMAWPCVLSWSRVAKAISRERLVDSSQNEEQNLYRIKISSRSKTTRKVETNPGMVPVWWMLLCFIAD